MATPTTVRTRYTVRRWAAEAHVESAGGEVFEAVEVTMLILLLDPD
jgi:hypothetical protein